MAAIAVKKDGDVISLLLQPYGRESRYYSPLLCKILK